MFELLSSFVAELRDVGVPISIAEHVDAARAVATIDVANAQLLRGALCATLVKRGDHLEVFDHTFDLFFSTRVNPLEPPPPPPDGVAAPSYGPAQAQSAGEFGEELLAALEQHDRVAMRHVAGVAVSRFAGMEPGRPVFDNYYLQRTLRQLDLGRVEERLVALALPEEADAVTERLVRDEITRRMAEFVDMIHDDIMQALIEDRGLAAMTAATREELPEDIDVMHATRAEMEKIERALLPLSRKLASRLARRRRRRRRGPIDMRHTIRASLSAGGVPVDVRFRPPHPRKPELIVIADISGSVASFARFTLLLVHAIAAEFSSVRAFAFKDGLDEVTHFFERGVEPSEAVRRIGEEAQTVAVDGNSDYGRALGIFLARYGHGLTRRHTVLILGDARNNYHAAHPEIMSDLRRRVKALYWLNPEPQNYWNSGDSVMDLYRPFCDRVVECRTLRHLEEFVGGLSS